LSRSSLLKRIFGDATRPGPLLSVGNTGTASIVQPHMLAMALIGGAIEYFAVEGIPPSRHELRALIRQGANELAAGLQGAKIPVTRLVGLADCPVDDGCTIATPWGEVRQATGRFADLTIGDRTANAMLVTYQEEPLLLIPQGSDLA